MKTKKDYRKNSIHFTMNEKSHESKMEKLRDNTRALKSFYNKDKKVSFVQVTIKSGWSKTSVKNIKKKYDMDAKENFHHSFFVSEKSYIKNPELLMNTIVNDINNTRKEVIKKDSKYEHLYNDSEIQIKFGYKKPKQIREYIPVKLKTKKGQIKFRDKYDMKKYREGK